MQIAWVRTPTIIQSSYTGGQVYALPYCLLSCFATASFGQSVSADDRGIISGVVRDPASRIWPERHCAS